MCRRVGAPSRRTNLWHRWRFECTHEQLPPFADKGLATGSESRERKQIPSEALTDSRLRLTPQGCPCFQIGDSHAISVILRDEQCVPLLQDGDRVTNAFGRVVARALRCDKPRHFQRWIGGLEDEFRCGVVKSDLTEIFGLLRGEDHSQSELARLAQKQIDWATLTE